MRHSRLCGGISCRGVRLVWGRDQTSRTPTRTGRLQLRPERWNRRNNERTGSQTGRPHARRTCVVRGSTQYEPRHQRCWQTRRGLYFINPLGMQLSCFGVHHSCNSSGNRRFLFAITRRRFRAGLKQKGPRLRRDPIWFIEISAFVTRVPSSSPGQSGLRSRNERPTTASEHRS